MQPSSHAAFKMCGVVGNDANEPKLNFKHKEDDYVRFHHEGTKVVEGHSKCCIKSSNNTVISLFLFITESSDNICFFFLLFPLL